jgi:hypothetical protein
MVHLPFRFRLNRELFPLRLSLVGNQIFYHYPAGTRLAIVTIVLSLCKQKRCLPFSSCP